MADIRTVVRRVVFAAGIAAAIAVAPALAALTDTPDVAGTVAQPIDCDAGATTELPGTCTPDVPGVSAPVVDAPPASAPNIENQPNQEQLEQGEHSGDHR